jgi:uncharacterized protein (TIGR03067 family)
MKTCWLVLGALAVAFVAGPVQAKKAKAKDAEKPEVQEMKFKYISVIIDGKETPEKELEGMILSVKGDKGVVMKGKKTLFAGTSKMDMTKTPWEIDVTITAGKDKGKVIKGIMEAKDGKMKVCWGAPDKDRPTEFSSKEGSGNVLEVLEELKTEKKPKEDK